MAYDYKQWSGDEWQKHVLLLLKRHYGPGKFQEVPDTDQGDAGLEGFSNDGCAYQCYAPKEPLSVQQRADKHKRKIYKDLRKFCKNQALLQPLLGSTKITCWILIVPRFDSKEVISYAESQAAVVRAAGLSYAAGAFCARITTGDEFAVEREQLLRVGLAKISVQVPPPAPADVEKWSQINANLVRVLDGKLARMKPASQAAALADLRGQLIGHYVAGQNAISALHNDFGELYEKVLEVKAQHEQFLATESMTATGLPTQVLRDTITAYEKSLAETVLGLDSHTAKMLVWEAVADWLLRCPLDFEKVA